MVNEDVLARRLPQLLGQERHVQVEFLLVLAEFDRARGYERMGYATLWDYCRKELGLLECAIYRRIHAARLLLRHPQVAELLRDGRLCMTSLVMLEEVLTEENAGELFTLASRKSKKEIEYLVACRRASVPEPKTLVRKLSAPRLAFSVCATERAGGAPTSTPWDLGFGLDAATVRDPAAAAVPVPVPVPAQRPATVRPVAEDRFTIRLTVGRVFVDTLAAAKRALSHRVPNGDLEQVLLAALDVLVEREAKRNAPTTPRAKRVAAHAESAPAPVADLTVVAGAVAVAVPAPAPAPAPAADGAIGAIGAKVSASKSAGRPTRRSIAAGVRREVWARDGGRCVWPTERGGTCGSQWQLELDHVVSFARGGASTAANIRLLCALCRARHNAHYSARRIMPRSSRRATVVTALYAA